MVTGESSENGKMRTKHGHDFFAEWMQRSESRKCKWQSAETQLNNSHFQLDHQIQNLRRKITDLVDQDAMLFEQFFALEDTIEELKSQMYNSDDDSDGCFSSLNSSTCSLASVREAKICSVAVDQHHQEREDDEDDVFEPWNQKGSANVFVRQRVSYPPISRNRCRRSQTVSATSDNKQKQGDDQDDEGVAGCERVVLRRLYSLQTHQHPLPELKSDGGESSVSSLDSGICIPASPSPVQQLDQRSKHVNFEREGEIFV